MKTHMKFSTRAIHAGQGPDPSTGATIVPISLSTTFTQEGLGKHKGYEYARSGNPTRDAFEQCIAALEEGEHGLAFASGLAATTAVISSLPTGSHVVASEDLYGGTWRLFEKVMRPLGYSFSYVSPVDPANYEEALRPDTRMVWLESPSNPLLQLSDIEAVARRLRGRAVGGDGGGDGGVLLAVDNTFASPYGQRPLQMGADVVVHSTTKYIGGHSDVVGGAVVTGNQSLYEDLKFYQNAAGGVMAPFDAWLTMRGLKTLAVRMDRHHHNAVAVANHLHERISASGGWGNAGAGVGERVVAVHYPGLASHPQHTLAKRQMGGWFGGMVTFELEGGLEAADRVGTRFRVFSLAESLGGVESLACHPATMTHGAIPREERERRGISDGMLRLSVGIEDAEDLVEDLEQAMGWAPLV